MRGLESITDVRRDSSDRDGELSICDILGPWICRAGGNMDITIEYCGE